MTMQTDMRFYVLCFSGMVLASACFGQETEPVLVEEPVLASTSEVVESAGSTNEYDNSRYDVIIARSPFGSEPLDPASNAAKPAEIKQLEKDLRLCFLLESQSGEVRAGFQNQKAKSGEPKSVILMEGESYRAMKLLEIDMENSTATLQYDGKPVIFELSKSKVAVASKKPASDTPSRRFGSGFRRSTPPAEEKAEEEPQLTEEEVAQQREAVRESLREYQMEVLRNNMPPLPIQLTPEQDDQLVEEGVLPPMAE